MKFIRKMKNKKELFVISVITIIAILALMSEIGIAQRLGSTEGYLSSAEKALAGSPDFTFEIEERIRKGSAVEGKELYAILTFPLVNSKTVRFDPDFYNDFRESLALPRQSQISSKTVLSEKIICNEEGKCEGEGTWELGSSRGDACSFKVKFIFSKPLPGDKESKSSIKIEKCIPIAEEGFCEPEFEFVSCTKRVSPATTQIARQGEQQQGVVDIGEIQG